MTQEEKTKAIRREAVRKWHANNKDKVKPHIKKWHSENKEKVNKWHQNKKQNDVLYKLECNIRSLITQAISRMGYKKNSKLNEILGCDGETFKQHIESQFKSWMNWDNWGCKTPSELNITWDLDHIIPVSSAVNEEEIIKLNHYTNLRPLCSYMNRFIKRDK